MNRIFWLVLVGQLALAVGYADEPKSEPPKKPPYERLLKGNNAKKADELDALSERRVLADDYAGAIRAAEELLVLRTRLQGLDHHEVVTLGHFLMALRKVAALPPEKRAEWRAVERDDADARELASKGRNDVALLKTQRLLKWRQELFGEDHPLTASGYGGVAGNLCALGKPAEAVPLFRRALDIDRRSLGEDHPDTATSYNNLAYSLNAVGRRAEAEPLYWRALDLCRRSLGEDHPDTATQYSNVASNLDALGRPAEAEPLHRKALDIHRRALGEIHRSTATSYDNLAGNLCALGKPAEATPLFRRALDIRRLALGEDHRDTARSCNNVASNLDALGRPAEAEPLHRMALDIRCKVLGEDHPDTARSYASVAFNLDAQGRPTEAEPLYRKALDIHRRSLGEDHPDTARSYNNAAFGLAAVGKGAEAEPLYRKALDIHRRSLGEDHPDTAIGYHNVAYNLNAVGKSTAAIDLLHRGIAAFESSRLSRGEGFERGLAERFNPRLLLAALQCEKEPNRAWGSVELSLARGLLDHCPAVYDSTLSEQELAERARLVKRLAALQPRIVRLVTTSNLTDAETGELNALLAERKTAEERKAVLGAVESERRVTSPHAIRGALPQDAALVLWVDVSAKGSDVQEHWGCVIRATGDAKWERLPGTGLKKNWTEADSALPAQLTRAITGGTTHVRLPITTTFSLLYGPPSPIRSTIESLAKQLRDQRITPLRKHLDGVTRLYVIPVHEMAGVPVEVIAPEFTIGYVPSGTYLARMREKATPPTAGVLAVGDPVFTNPNEKSLPAKRLPPGGLLVTLVVPGGAAANARLQSGDVLLKYGNTDLISAESLSKAVAAHAERKSVPVVVWREDQEKTATRDLAPGRMGVVVATDPAPVAIADRRKMDAALASRGGPWRELPGTRVETARLKALFGETATVLTDSAASEQKLDALRGAGGLSKFRYLHFATHGEGNNTRAFESAIILAQDGLPKEPESKPNEPWLNGQVSAREVLDYWKLDAELVTLSACETAVGKPGGGDGTLGFAQAFLTAGSRAVCLSLWKVDDTATALLMDRFYQNLLGKRAGLTAPMGKAAALAEAKKWLRELPSDEVMKRTAELTNGLTRGPDQAALKLAPPKQADAVPKGTPMFAHPRYWAAFILIGDPN